MAPVTKNETEKKGKKEKKEKKFNSDRTARLVKSALKAVFPKDNFIVSSFMERVEVLYFGNTNCSVAELNMFNILFCNLANVKKEQLQFALIKKVSIHAPARGATQTRKALF